MDSIALTQNTEINNQLNAVSSLIMGELPHVEITNEQLNALISELLDYWIAEYIELTSKEARHAAQSQQTSNPSCALPSRI